MTQDEIIAMANEAGLNSYRIAPGEAVAVWGRFAALVAAKAASRATEACAVLALDKAGTTDYDYSTCINIAAVIRARGQKEGA